MKKIFRYIMILFIGICVFAACKKMDSTYKDFIVPGGLTYTGRITSPIVQGGLNRVKLSWLRGSDPNVTRAKVFWNNYSDSVIVPIPSVSDTINVMISNLEEKPYTFIVRTYDDKGNTSIPVELLGESFGAKFQSFVVSRPVNNSENTGTELTIQWGNANITGGAYATVVEYTNTANQTAVKRFGVGQASSTISDYKVGTTYRYRTEYRPGNSIDPFYTAYSTQPVSFKIPKAGLVVTTDSFAATSQLANGGGPPGYAFDDNLSTFWHTHHTPGTVPPYPHWLAVDLKKTYKVTRVELTTRAGATGVTNSPTAFTIQGSMNGTTWTDYGSYTLAQKDQPQSFMLASAATMRHFRIYATAGGGVHASLAEFTVFGYE